MAISEGQFQCLRKQLDGIDGNAGDTVRSLIRDHWCEIKSIAEQYSNDLNPEPEEPSGNWGDAIKQWKRVQDTAKALRDALKNLGPLASGIRWDTARRIGGICPQPCERKATSKVINRREWTHKPTWNQKPTYTEMWERKWEHRGEPRGIWKRVEPFISPTSGFSSAPPIVFDLECFAKAAMTVSAEMRMTCNGRHSTAKDTALQTLFHNLFRFEIPEDHAQQIAAVIHGWVEEPVPEERIDRFGERAIKRVRQLHAEFAPKDVDGSRLPQV